MPRNRWTEEEPDGTPCHELLILPTFAPHLARPEILVPRNAGRQSPEGVAITGKLHFCHISPIQTNKWQTQLWVLLWPLRLYPTQLVSVKYDSAMST
jgi:hypothetical protein